MFTISQMFFFGINILLLQVDEDHTAMVRVVVKSPPFRRETSSFSAGRVRPSASAS